jgi:hypothetical protein
MYSQKPSSLKLSFGQLPKVNCQKSVLPYSGVYQLGRSVTKTLLFLTFYRAFVQNFDRAFEKKRCRAFVSFLQGSRIDFDRVFVSILTGSSYRFYKVHLSVLQGFRINFDRAFVPLLQDHRNVKAVSVISSQILLTEFVLRLVFYQNYDENISRAEREKRKIDVDKL